MSANPAASVITLTHQQTRDLLSTYPATQTLVDEVFSFFQSRVQIIDRSTSSGISNFYFEIDPIGLTFDNAKIELLDCKGKIEENLTHELLHVKQLRVGLPLIRQLQIFPAPGTLNQDLLSTIVKVKNVVDHDIFINEFENLGFSRSRFLKKPVKRDNYKKLSKIRNHKLVPEVMRPYVTVYWAFEYLRNYISINHGAPECRMISVDVERWGMIAVPNFSDITSSIREWIKSGEHKNIADYNRAFRNLFEIMHFPRINSFHRLEKADDGSFKLVIC